MNVKLIFFNVLHGDSALLEVEKDGQYSYLVIDCNIVKSSTGYEVPVYNYLKSKNVTHINGILITHFHQDHIDGIGKLLSSEFQVGRIYIPPVLNSNSASHDKLINKYRDDIIKVLERTDEETLNSKLSSFAIFLRYIKDNSEDVEECVGRENKFRVPGFPPEIEGTIYLPLKKMRGVIKEAIEKGNFGLDSFPNLNDASIAVAFDINGTKILLAGDSPPVQWNEHKRQMKTYAINCLEINCLKAFHHGSKYNNKDGIYEYILNSGDNNCVIISADGLSHPDPEMFELINKYKLKPYCTNISSQCVEEYENMELSSVPEVFKPFIKNYQQLSPTPCQGDIYYSLNTSDNKINVTNTTNTPCVYHFS